MSNDIFISCKNLDEHGVQTRDSEIAAEVYKFLTGKGLSVFLSTFTLEQLGASAYTREIDSALESATVLLAIGTSADHLNSEWVRYEWDSFSNAIRSGGKPHISPLLLGWSAAALVRIATGSATVATITGAGIVAPIVQAEPGANKELMVLATGAGSLILSHVNDAGFWLVKEYLQLSLPDTFRTAMETLLSVLGLIFVLLLGHVV